MEQEVIEISIKDLADKVCFCPFPHVDASRGLDEEMYSGLHPTYISLMTRQTLCTQCNHFAEMILLSTREIGYECPIMVLEFEIPYLELWMHLQQTTFATAFTNLVQ